MNRRRKLILIISTVLLLVSIITSTAVSALSVAVDRDLGASPYINNLGNSLKVDSSKFYDGTVIHRLPDSVKDTDELSLIIEINENAILDAYRSTDTTMSLTEFYSSETAVAIRKNDTPEILQKRVMKQAEWKILPLSCEKVSKEIMDAKGNN